MSGRLIITGKKSYTPWNEANIERVLRDERIEKERVEKQQQKSREEQSKERIRLMKKRKYEDGDVTDDDGGGGDTDRGRNRNDTGQDSQLAQHVSVQQHVNLFEMEEKKMLQSAILGPGGDHAQKKSNAGIMPVFLSKKNKEEHEADDGAFYKRKLVLRTELDDEIKDKMDPMRRFHPHPQNKSSGDGDDEIADISSTRRSKRRAKTIQSDDDSISSSSSSSSRSSDHRRRRKRRRRSKRDEKHRHTDTSEKRSRSRSKQTSRAKDNSNSKPTKLEELRRRQFERSAKESEREKALKMGSRHG